MKFLITSFTSLLLFVFLTNTVLAHNASSSNFKMQMGNFNFVSGEKSSDNYSLHETGGELSPGESNSSSFTVKSGFEYVRTLTPFSFTISNNYIDFGTVNPETFYTDTTNLTVTSGAAFGYTVTVQSNHPLYHNAYNDGSVTIPDTTGDSGNITHIQNGNWSNTSTYGFGYSLANVTGTDATFTSGFKQFPSDSLSEEPVNIMENIGATSESEVEVTYKLNISPSQSSGTYQNIVTYILTGTF